MELIVDVCMSVIKIGEKSHMYIGEQAVCTHIDDTNFLPIIQSRKDSTFSNAILDILVNYY